MSETEEKETEESQEVTQFTEQHALRAAIWAAKHSPCKKSKRGVAIFDRRMGLLKTGTNHPPGSLKCDGSDQCREHCNRICIHAEMDAILKLDDADYMYNAGLELLHVKVDGIVPVSSGPPSCAECSKHILQAGIEWVWLLHDELRRYDAETFHLISLAQNGLPAIK